MCWFAAIRAKRSTVKPRCFVEFRCDKRAVLSQNAAKWGYCETQYSETLVKRDNLHHCYRNAVPLWKDVQCFRINQPV